MLALALLLANTTPITKMGPSCPFGYYSASGYCVPSAALERRTQSIPRTETTCPFGTYKAGNYCTWSPRY
jgi:hypothetical protein